jgi:hypothetical protein
MKDRDEDHAKNEQLDVPELEEGLPVKTGDDQALGTVQAVFRGLGESETFGSTGIRPEQADYEPGQYAFSEAMPGQGDDYFVVTPNEGDILYIPFSSIYEVRDGTVILSVDHDNVDDMNWHVRPDALKSFPEYEVDTGGESWVA